MDIDERKCSTSKFLSYAAAAGVPKPSASKAQLVVLSLSSFIFLMIIVREQTELTRLEALNHLLLQSTQQNSFGFFSTTLTSINGSRACVSREVNEGDFVRNIDGTYSAHIMTTTEVKYPGREAKTMRAERLFDRNDHDGWIRYHQLFPDQSLGSSRALGEWQTMEEILDDALAMLSGQDGEMFVKKAGDILHSSAPSPDVTAVFPLFEDDSTRWVGKQRRKGSLRCFHVDLYPGALLEKDTMAFDFIGPGVGLSTLGKDVARGSRVWAEYCVNSGGLIETMMAEAVAGGWWGFHFKKEVQIRGYNKRVDFPKPKARVASG